MNKTNRYIIIVVAIIIAMFSPCMTFASTIGRPVNYLAANSGLVGWWTFDGPKLLQNVTDSSGQGNNGFLSGFTSTSSAQVAGKIGQALDLKTDTSIVYFNSPASLNTLTTKTIAAWIYLRSYGPNDWGVILGSFTNPVTDASYFFAICTNDSDGECPDNDNVLKLGGVKTTSIYGGWATGNILQLNKWQHVAVTYDCSSTSNVPVFYYNGQVSPIVSTDSPTGTMVCDDSDRLKQMSIADGKVDDLRVYNRILSASEMATLYSASMTKYNVSRSIGTLSTGLVGWWTFDGPSLLQNVADSSGQGNNGDLVGFTSTTTVAGKLGQAFNFPGKNQYYVSMGNQASLSLTTAGTVSLWSKSTPNNNYQTLVSKHDLTADRNGYNMYVDCTSNCQAFMQIASASAFQQIHSNTNVADNKWHHIVETWDNSNIYIYVDGIQESTAAQTLTVVSNVYGFDIGADTPTGNYTANGALDDVRIYNRAISPTEVTQLYNQGK